MTREEFRDDIQDWEDLLTFCRDNDLEDCVEGIVRKDEIEGIARDRLNYEGWESLVNFFANINNTCGGHYHIDDYGNLEELEYGDFDVYKNDAEASYDFDDDDDDDDCPLEI